MNQNFGREMPGAPIPTGHFTKLHQPWRVNGHRF